MKDASPCSNRIDSPKTPGGISKSLLTPCRRVGLSRKWKKGGCSPFVSPLSTQDNTPERVEGRELRKKNKGDKKETLQDIDVDNTPQEQQLLTESSTGTPQLCYISNTNDGITNTPCRNTQLTRKKSKTLSLKNCEEDRTAEKISEKKSKQNLIPCENDVVNVQAVSPKVNNLKNVEMRDEEVVQPVKQTSAEIVSKPIRTGSKGKSKLSLKRLNSNSDCMQEAKLQKHEKPCDNIKLKEKPNNLTKECIVVIQNKILKVDTNTIKSDVLSSESDSESDVPLSLVNKENTEKATLKLPDNEDAIQKSLKDSSFKKKLKKLSIIKPTQNDNKLVETSQASQSSQECIDKRTILIKKSYDKITKPTKAKSTGSITQKDIDDLRERIEMKRNLLMAKAMSIDTEELRTLIKKWQKGCQDALMELLDLMKRKLPDRQNMDYAEILQTLKIPPELVGYDSENDCFVTPDDTNVLLSTFKL